MLKAHAEKHALIPGLFLAVSRFSVVAKITKSIHCLDLRNHMLLLFCALQGPLVLHVHTLTHTHPPLALFSIPEFTAPLIVPQEAEELCKANNLSSKHVHMSTYGCWKITAAAVDL